MKELLHGKETIKTEWTDSLQNGRTYLQTMCPTKDWYPESIRNLSQPEKKNPIKNGKMTWTDISQKKT